MASCHASYFKYVTKNILYYQTSNTAFSAHSNISSRSKVLKKVINSNLVWFSMLFSEFFMIDYARKMLFVCIMTLCQIETWQMTDWTLEMIHGGNGREYRESVTYARQTAMVARKQLLTNWTRIQGSVTYCSAFMYSCLSYLWCSCTDQSRACVP